MLQASRSSSAGRTLLIAASGVAATAGAIFVLGRATGSFAQHLALVLAAVGIAVLGIWLAPGERSRIRLVAIGSVLATLVAAVALGGVLSQERVVDEQVVTAPARSGDAMAKPTGDAMAKPEQNVLVSEGSFEPLEHPGEGTARIIRTTDGRTVLTLTGFSTDAGPDLDVRLVAGNPSSDADVEAGRSVRLGRLTGTSGDQQYVLPEGVDPAEFSHVYVWCRAFSVGFTRAALG